MEVESKMNLKSLQIFVSVLEEGSLGRAAKKMNLSQSAASRLLQLLEQEYNTKLFFRDNKRLTPTSAGELFYPEAIRILASVKAIPTLFEQIKSESIAPLKIICHPRLINGLILPAMIAFIEKYSEVKLILEVHPRRYLGQRILHDNYDIGISNLPLPVENFDAQAILKSQIQVLLPKSHFLAKKAFLTPDDLKHVPYIALDKTTLLRQLTDLELAKSGKSIFPKHEVSSASVALGLVRSGLGYMLTDNLMLDPDIKKEIVLVPWKPLTFIQVGYFINRYGRPHPYLDQFKQCLVDSIGRY